MITHFHKRLISWASIVLLLLFMISIIYSNENDKKKELSRNKSELNKLDNAIKADKKKVNQLKSTEKKHTRILKSYASDYESIKRNIQNIERDLILIGDSIDYLSYILLDANKALNQTKESFTKLATSLYALESSRGSKLPAYFSYRDKNLDHLLFRHINSGAGKKIKDIYRFIDSTQVLISLLNDKIDRQEQLRNAKDSEKKKLNKLINQQKSKVEDIRHNVGELEKQIRQRERSSRALRELINKLSEDEKPILTSKEKPVFKSVSRFTWPSSGRTISRNFGTATDPATRLEFDNPGIDIAAKYGSPVFAVDNGEISLLHWLPGYGSIIVINHGSNLRSVYGNLLTLNVRKGQKVSRGMTIGTSGRSIDGEILHFEVWDGNKRINPLTYLK
jgi:septal ring factor EnvC (AmiA/AmiB activator)